MSEPVKDTISRFDAQRLGLTRYFTGIPCLRGHVSERFTKYSNCVTCQVDNARKRYEKSEVRQKKLEANAEWRKNNKQRLSVYVRKWRLAHPEYKERAAALRRTEQRRAYDLERNRIWTNQNRGRSRERARGYYYRDKERSPELVRERTRIGMLHWRRQNPEKARAAKLRRRATEASAIGSHTAQELKALFEKQLSCQGCGIIFGSCVKATVDHIMPLARGGSNDIENLQLLCRSCNSSKGTRL